MTALVDATIEQVGALDALTEMLVEVERTISSMQAVRDGILATGSRLALQVAEQAEHPDHGDLTLRTVAAEMGAALRVSDRTVQRRMADAVWRVERFPLVWAAQGAGRLSAAHARVIAEAGEHLDDAGARDQYSSQMIEFAQTESSNRVARMARRTAERFQPRSIDERHEKARHGRRVWITDTADGMAQLGLIGPAALVHGVFDRLTRMATAVEEQRRSAATHDAADGADAGAGAGADARTRDQLRTDLALELLLAETPLSHDTPDALLGRIVGTVSITVPATTLRGRDTAPAELDGSVAIDPHTARQLAGAASGWDRLFTHPVSGALLAVDRYRPGADLKRLLRARDQRCRFPTCGHLATDSDIDHTRDAALGGATAHENLGHLCRRHHTLKHHSPWQVEQRPGGLFAWTSPTGRTYIDRPPPPNTVTFTEDTFTRDGARPPF